MKGGYVGITWRLRDLGWLHRARKRVEACQVGRTAGHLQHRPHSSSSHRAADALPRVGDHSLQPAQADTIVQVERLVGNEHDVWN